MEFKCSRCGGCCAFASLFGLPVKEDGYCAYLVDNKCSIYEDRPDVCRVDSRMREGLGMSKKNYYRESTKVCHQIIDALGIDESYKIDLNEYDRD